MKKYLLIAATQLLLLVSCSEKPTVYPENTFEERIVGFSTTYRDDNYIELPDLYDKPTQFIPEDKDESLILAQKLETRGFKETGRSRKNFPMLEKQVVTLVMRKGDCECEVNKIYNKTAYVGQYSKSEQIKCATVK